MDQFGPDLITKLTTEGLQGSGRMSEVIGLVGPTHIATLLDDALLTNGQRLPAVKNFPAGGFTETPWIDGSLGFAEIGEQGENYVKAMRGIASNVAQYRTAIPGTDYYRYYDLVVDGTLFIEVKTGRVRLTKFIRQQIDRDAAVIANDGTVLWAFVGNGKTGVGPDPRVLALLIEKNIPFEIHWPA